VSQATQTARAWLNQCSELSKSGRHEEARGVALQVEQNITNLLLPEAHALASAGDKRGPEVVQDLRVLQCAALLARALDAQAPGDSATWSGASLYLEAKELAESFLPPIHPMVSLTRSLCDDRGVSASSGNAPVTLPSLSPKGNRQIPTSPTRSSASTSQVPALPEQKPEPAAAAPSQVAPPSPTQGSDPEKTGKSEREAADTTEKISFEPTQRMPSHRSQASGSQHGDEEDDHEHDQDHYHDDDHVPRAPKNIFAEYLQDFQLEKEMSKPWFNNRQDELRKHVTEQARFVRLQNKGKNVAELSNPKFTSCGHKIQIKQLAKLNNSRSEPALMQQVKMAGVASPEAFLTSKLRLVLDPQAKPMIVAKRRRAIIS